MNMKKKLVAAVCTLLCGSAFVTSALAAGPQIGENPGGGFIYADKWTHASSTGSDEWIPTAGVTNPFQVGAVHLFTTQFSVGTVEVNGQVIGRNQGLNDTYEITKVLKFLDVVTAPFDGSTVKFGFAAQPTNVQLEIYLDKLASPYTDQATSGSGASTVRGYGSTDSTGFTGGPGPGGNTVVGTGGDGDGILIARANLIGEVSSFTLNAPGTPGAGTGSFDLSFLYTYANTTYLDLSNPVGNTIIGERLTGSLTQPLSTNFPSLMWDGTPTGDVTGASGHTAFTVDSSQSWIVVPEPGSLALLSVGLLAMARRGKKSAS